MAPEVNASFLSKRKYSGSYFLSMITNPIEEDEWQGEEEKTEDNSISNDKSTPIEVGLPEDTYSILLVAKVWTSPLYYAVSFICFQLSLLVLIIQSLLFHAHGDNIYDVPEGINLLVVLGQGLAIILAACTAEDLLNALAFIFISVDENLIASIPELTNTRWRIAFGLKFIEGSLCLFTIFVLIIQSSTVIGLCLNFAALSFVWAIDDTFFSLGQRGFFSKGLAKCTYRISNTRILVHEHEKVHQYRNYAFYIVTLCLVTTWIYFTVQQLNGVFICENLLVQFDDIYEPEVSVLSGVYKRKNLDYLFYAIYEGEEIPNGNKAYPVIAFCREIQSWTLSIKEPGKAYSKCDWKAKSRVTRLTNILEVNSDWIVNVESTTESGSFGSLPFVDMSIECIDCYNSFEPTRDNCNNKHIGCKSNICECDESHYGLSCEFLQPCEKLALYNYDEQLNRTFSDGTSVLYNFSMTILKDKNDKLVENKNRPVWYQVHDKFCDFIFFQGYRWIFRTYYSYDDEHSLHKNETELPSLALEIMKKGLTFEKDPPANFKTLYYSEPRPQSSLNDKSAPIFIKWYRALPDRVDTVDSKPFTAVCAGCSDQQKCRHNGVCVNGKCQCKTCSKGVLCEQISCEGVGEDYFNEKDKKYDQM